MVRADTSRHVRVLSHDDGDDDGNDDCVDDGDDDCNDDGDDDGGDDGDDDGNLWQSLALKISGNVLKLLEIYSIEWNWLKIYRNRFRDRGNGIWIGVTRFPGLVILVHPYPTTNLKGGGEIANIITDGFYEHPLTLLNIFILVIVRE